MNVLQEWVMVLPLKMQTVLISAIRRPDIGGGPEVTTAVRWLRYYMLVDGNNGKGSFMEHGKNPVCTKEFMHDFVTCSMHFSLHLLHAYEIIARKHDDVHIRVVADSFYYACCEAMHVSPETYDEMCIRLSDGHEANCWK